MAHQSISLDAILGRYAGRQRDALLPAWWDVDGVRAHLHRGGARISTRPARVVAGVRRDRLTRCSASIPSKIAIHVHQPRAAWPVGRTAQTCERRLGIEPGDTPDGRYGGDTTCLSCAIAPAALVSGAGKHSCAPDAAGELFS